MTKTQKLGDVLWRVDFCSKESEYPGFCRLVEYRVTRVALRRRSKIMMRFSKSPLNDIKLVHVTSELGEKDSWEQNFKPDVYRPTIKSAYRAAMERARQWDPKALPMIKSSKTRRLCK